MIEIGDSPQEKQAGKDLFENRSAIMSRAGIKGAEADQYRRVWVNGAPSAVWFVGDTDKADGLVRQRLGIRKASKGRKGYVGQDGNKVTCSVLNLPAATDPYNIDLPAKMRAKLDETDEKSANDQTMKPE